MPENWVALEADHEEKGGRIIVRWPRDGATLAVNRRDLRTTNKTVEVRVGAVVEILVQPLADKKHDQTTDRESEVFATACIGASINPRIPGVLVRCDTGEVLGKCWQSYPCE